MEPEVSLQCLIKPTIEPCPWSAESDPYYPFYFINLQLFLLLRLGLSSGFFSSGFLVEILYTALFSTYI